MSRDGTKSYTESYKKSLNKRSNGIFTNFENYELSRAKQMERENKQLGKNSVKSY